MVVKPGDSASVPCSATGHPKPTIQWLNKSNKGVMVRAIGLLAQILEWNVFKNVSKNFDWNLSVLLHADGVGV